MSETQECTALGAAILGGLGAGVYSDLEDLKANVIQKTRIIQPDRELKDRYDETFKTYCQVYPALKELNARIENENE